MEETRNKMARGVFGHFFRYELPPFANPVMLRHDSLFTLGLYTDLLHLCNGESWEVHRAILSSESEWFERAFEDGFLVGWPSHGFYCGELILDCHLLGGWREQH